MSRICPKCKHYRMDCKDSRNRGIFTRRRYKCPNCGHRLSTIEHEVDAEALPPELHTYQGIQRMYRRWQKLRLLILGAGD